MTRSRTLSWLVIAALLTLPATGRGAEPVSIGIVGALSDVVIFIADKKNYLREEGFDPKITLFVSAAVMVAPLGAGQLDVGAGSASAGLFNAVAQGVKLRIVADKSSSQPGYPVVQLLVLKSHVESGRYKEIRDLKGMKIAEVGTGIPNVVTLADIVKLGGLSLADVETVTLPFPDHIVAMKNGAVDGSIAAEPTASIALQTGLAVRVKKDDEIYPGHTVGQLLYSDGFAEKPDLAKRFARSYLRAVRFYNDALKDGKLAGPTAEEVIAILTQSTPIKDASLYRSILPHGLDPDGRVNIESLKHDMDLYRAQGLLIGSVAVEQVVDRSFMDVARGEMGPYQKAK
jgi:NitT/TauT family transport system substrate-binding protein